MLETGFFQHGPVTIGVGSENTAFVQLAIEFFWFVLGRFQLEWQPGTKNPTRRANARNAAPVCYSSLGADLSATPENTNNGGVLRGQEKSTYNTGGYSSPGSNHVMPPMRPSTQPSIGAVSGHCSCHSVEDIRQSTAHRPTRCCRRRLRGAITPQTSLMRPTCESRNVKTGVWWRKNCQQKCQNSRNRKQMNVAPGAIFNTRKDGT